MTAQSSKNSRFLQYYLYRLGKLRFLMILLAIFGMFTFPLYSAVNDRYAVASLGLDEAETSRLGTYQALANDLCLKILWIAVMCGLVVMLLILLEGFRYLHKKRFTDMDMSLPITHTQRFFGDLLAVMTAQFIPLLAACGIGEAVVLHTRGYDASGFAGSGMTASYLMNCDRVDGMIPQFLICALMLLFMSLFVMSFCGRTSTAVMMLTAVQIAVPLITVMLWEISALNTYGMNQNALTLSRSFMMLLSPFGYALAAGGGRLYYYLGVSKAGYVFLALYMAALCAGAYFAQKYRRSERTGEPFVYRYSRHAFTALFVFAVTAFFGCRIITPEIAIYVGLYQLFGGAGTSYSDWLFIILWAVSVIIIFAVMEAVGGGKLKDLPLSLLRISVTAGVCFGICELAAIVGDIGFENYVPSANEADSAEIYFRNGSDSSMSTYTVPYETAAELHRRILKERPGHTGMRQYHTDPISVRITYNYNGEYTAERLYGLDESYVRDMYDMYFEYDGFAEQYRDETIPANARPTGEYELIFPGTDGSTEPSAPPVRIDGIREALIADAEEVTFEQVYLSAYRDPLYITVRTNYEYPRDSVTGIGAGTVVTHSYAVYPFFTRTLELLKAKGFDLFAGDPLAGYDRALIVRRDTSSDSAQTMYSSETGYHSSYFDMNDAVNSGDSSRVREIDIGSPEFAEIFSGTASVSYYQNDERYYLVLFSDPEGSSVREKYLTVTEAYTARAGEIWAEAQPPTGKSRSREKTPATLPRDWS